MTLDYDQMRGMDNDEHRLFYAHGHPRLGGVQLSPAVAA
jgi:hypothetical protein